MGWNLHYFSVLMNATKYRRYMQQWFCHVVTLSVGMWWWLLIVRATIKHDALWLNYQHEGKFWVLIFLPRALYLNIALTVIHHMFCRMTNCWHFLKFKIFLILDNNFKIIIWPLSVDSRSDVVCRKTTDSECSYSTLHYETYKCINKWCVETLLAIRKSRGWSHWIWKIDKN